MTSPAAEWLDREAPRYTSYPTAHHFTPEVDQATHAAWLGALAPDANVSVYAHIPFCREMCWFCGCHTKATLQYAPVVAYTQQLVAEIRLLKHYTKGNGRLRAIHFGGGSPSLLEQPELEAILEAVTETFEYQGGGECAIELDPRTATPEKIALYGALGINRVSIGIQDMDEAVQRAINRIQPYEMVAEVVSNLRAAGIADINADLVYGLPLQTMERFAATLEQTLTLAPSRLALFSYAHLPELKKHQRLIPVESLPSVRDKLALYQYARERLEAAGYVAIGIDHFARPDDALAIAYQNGTMRRNFQGYVTDACDVLLGVGGSSISQFPQGYVQNLVATPDYTARIQAGELATARGVAFMGDDLARKAVIDALMCYLSADLAAIARTYGLPAHYFTRELTALLDYRDLAVVEDGCVTLITEDRMAARVIASLFDRYHTVRRYSKVA